MAWRFAFVAMFGLGTADVVWLDRELAPAVVDPPQRVGAEPAAAPVVAPSAAAAPVAAVAPAIVVEPLPAPAVTQLSVYFQPGSWELDDAAQRALARYDRDAARAIVVEAHSDGRGHESANRALRVHRALAVRDYLATLGVAVDRLQLRDPGPATATTDDDLWRDCRVELHPPGGTP